MPELINMVVQYEFAKDEDNNVVNIIRAIPHKKYACANDECGSEMIPVFGVTGRAYHFRHENLNTNFLHEGETELHYNTKHLIAQRIRNTTDLYYHYISKLTGNYVGRINLHSGDGNLDVILEKRLSSDYRPDISVLKNGKLLYIIEIIVSHDVELPFREYLEKNKILCIKIYTSEALYQLYKKSDCIDFWSTDSNNEYLNFSCYDNRFREAEEKEQADINRVINEYKADYENKQAILMERKTQLEKTIEEQEKLILRRLDDINQGIYETENKIKCLHNNLSVLVNASPDNKWWYDNISKKLVVFEKDIDQVPIKLVEILNNGLSLYKCNGYYIEYNPRTHVG